MKTLKTAVSIPEDTFLQVEEMAKRLGMKRSQLIAAALAEYLERHGEDRITERLNSVYEHEVSGLDPMLAKMQFSGRSHEDW